MNPIQWVLTAAALLPGLAGAADWPSYPFVHSNATATAFASPDTAEIAFDILSVQADPQLGAQAVDAGIAKIRALVDGLGANVASVEIQDMRKSERADKAPKADDPAAAAPAPLYEVRAAASITVRDLTGWKPLISALIGLREIESPSSVFSSSAQARLEQDLMAQALRKARGRAEAVAAGLGRKLDAVGAVSTGNLANVTNAIGLGAPEAQRSAGMVRVNGPLRGQADWPVIKFSQSVDVIFKLK